MNGQNETPYDRQVFIVPKGENKWDIVKRIKFAEGTKVLRSSIRSMCTGRTLEIEYCKQCREGSVAVQTSSGRFLGTMAAAWSIGVAALSVGIGSSPAMEPLILRLKGMARSWQPLKQRVSVRCCAGQVTPDPRPINPQP
ncbi:unnamed protein product [Symbiodinium natans]|uniref:Uncharacterized protein n=1 Tax=Symbiodinium natans TaxID=878477 RepID=A0A812P5K8_9DINO|nr:unnamed protein product [Symbiodinium natans]